MSIEDALNLAAKELPEDFIIEINVERGAGWVTLYDGHGNDVSLAGDGTISEQVEDAINQAKKLSTAKE